MQQFFVFFFIINRIKNFCAIIIIVKVVINMNIDYEKIQQSINEYGKYILNCIKNQYNSSLTQEQLQNIESLLNTEFIVIEKPTKRKTVTSWKIFLSNCELFFFLSFIFISLSKFFCCYANNSDIHRKIPFSNYQL